jgi:hypothetical protein
MATAKTTTTIRKVTKPAVLDTMGFFFLGRSRERMKDTDSPKSDSDSEPLSFPIEVSGSVLSSYREGIVANDPDVCSSPTGR